MLRNNFNDFISQFFRIIDLSKDSYCQFNTFNLMFKLYLTLVFFPCIWVKNNQASFSGKLTPTYIMQYDGRYDYILVPVFKSYQLSSIFQARFSMSGIVTFILIG